MRVCIYTRAWGSAMHSVPSASMGFQAISPADHSTKQLWLFLSRPSSVCTSSSSVYYSMVCLSCECCADGHASKLSAYDPPFPLSVLLVVVTMYVRSKLAHILLYSSPSCARSIPWLEYGTTNILLMVPVAPIRNEPISG